MANITDSSDRFINRELSWLEFNQRVLGEGLNKDNPLAERLKFLAIVSSNLDEFFMIRVAGLIQQKKAGMRRKDRSGLTSSQQLEAISERTIKMASDQTDGINDVLKELEKSSFRLVSSGNWSFDQMEAVHTYFLNEVLPILTPLAVEDLQEYGLAPILAGLQLIVAVELSGGKTTSVAYQMGQMRRHLAAGGTLDNFDPAKRYADSPSDFGAKSKPDEGSNDLEASCFAEAKGAVASEKAVAGLSGQAPQQRSCIAVVPIPKQLPRFIKIPAAKGETAYALIEDVVQVNAGLLFSGCKMGSTAVFRLTRDGDVCVDDKSLGSDFEEATDLTVVLEEAVVQRKSRDVVRLEISDGAPKSIRNWLIQMTKVEPEFVFDIQGLMDAKGLFALADLPALSKFRAEDWKPQTPRDLLNNSKNCDLWELIRERDRLLSLPYESFDPVVKLIERAAEDPDVLAIKQTLYRTSGKSPIVRALENAALNGKEVTVLVELRARFDEAQNIQWARRLERAGCNVIYGIVGLKTHAKALLIVRRENGRIRRYAHLATGNYNDKTAKLYSDLGILTCETGIVSDLAAFFNLLSGYSEVVGWKHLTVEPHLLKQKILDMIEREINLSTPEQPGRIMLKCNSLEHPDIIDALYRASQAGVKIQINVRGICCLRPGVKGLSENIHVCSIVDRYLEHSRIYYFQNGMHPELYLSSADLMVRNLDSRLEIIFPILNDNIQARLMDMLKIYFKDNQRGWRLDKNGDWRRVKPNGAELIRAQETLYRQAQDAEARAAAEPGEYIPIRGKNSSEAEA